MEEEVMDTIRVHLDCCSGIWWEKSNVVNTRREISSKNQIVVH